MTDTRISLDRRRFLQGALGASAGLALTSPFTALGARAAGAGPADRPTAAGYGPLLPVRDQTTGLELLLLPRGFEYTSFGWTNDPMSDGTPTPSARSACRFGSRLRDRPTAAESRPPPRSRSASWSPTARPRNRLNG